MKYRIEYISGGQSTIEANNDKVLRQKMKPSCFGIVINRLEAEND